MMRYGIETSRLAALLSIGLAFLLSAVADRVTAQEELFCAEGMSDEGSNIPGPDFRGGNPGPVPADTLRALVIFARCPDESSGTSCGLANGGSYSENWNDPQELPPWHDEIIEDTETPQSFVPQIPGSLTHYFHTMSGGKHLLLGRVYPSVVTTSINISSLGCIKYGSRLMNGDVFGIVDAALDFGEFDINGPGQTPDGYVDNIIVYYWSPMSKASCSGGCALPARLNWITVCGQTFGGEARVLNANMNVDIGDADPKTISADIGATIFPLAFPATSFCGGVGEPPTRVRNRWVAFSVMAHEYFHRMFDDVWPALGNTSVSCVANGGHIVSAGPYDLMGGGALLCAATRIKANWLVPLDLPTRTVAWDSTIVLRDAGRFTEGSAAILRTADSNQYFVLEARSNATSPYEKTQPPDAVYDCCKTKGGQSGLFISHIYESGQRGWYTSLDGCATAAKPPAFDPEIADGLFDLADAAPDPIAGSDSLKAYERTPSLRITSQPKDLFRPGSGFSNTWGPYTNPNSNLYSSTTDSTQSVYSGWSVYNIEWAGPGTDSTRFHVRFDPVGPPSSGGADTLRADSTAWEGITQLTGDLVLAPGATLTIKPGAQVYAATTDRHAGGKNASKTEPIIRGRLLSGEAGGAGVTFSSSRDNAFVHFRGAGESSAPAAGDWHGPRFDLAGAPNSTYGYIASVQRPSKLKSTTISYSKVGVQIEGLCAPGLESVTFSNIEPGSGGAPTKHVLLDSTDVALPYGWWDGTPDVQGNFRLDPVKWDIEAPLNVVATNAVLSGRDHPLGYGHSSLVDCFIDGLANTRNEVGPTNAYVVFRPVTANDATGDGWGGIQVNAQAKGTTFRFAEVMHAVDPFLFAYPESCKVAKSKIHHYAGYGIWAKGGGANALTIQESQILRGPSLGSSKGLWGIYAEQSPSLRVKSNAIYDYSHEASTSWTQSSVPGGGMRVANTGQFCGTTLSNPDSVVIQGNTFVGPGENFTDAARIGVQLDWACGTSNREVAVLGNAMSQWLSGLQINESRDVQINCNRVENNRRGIELARATIPASDPEVRFKSNLVDSSQASTILVWSGMEEFALGSGVSTSDRGLNKFEVVGGLQFYVTQNDGSFNALTDFLHAQQNHWFDGLVDSTESAIRVQCEPTTGPNRDQIEADSPKLAHPYSISCLPASPSLAAPTAEVGAASFRLAESAWESGVSMAATNETAPIIAGDPTESELTAILPNPTRGETVVKFAVARADRGFVRVAVYDVTGRRVRLLKDGASNLGLFEVIWNGSDERGRRVRSGVYFVRLETPSRSESRKLLLVR